MRQVRLVTLSMLIVLLCSLFGQGQQGVGTAANGVAPPPLIQFSSIGTDEGGNTLSGVVNITFSLYNSQRGGESLWSETQNNVPLDPTGHYSVQLGITKPSGVPTALFTTGEARWLGVQIAGQAEQTRVLLLSVPYALKAGDATTIGGLPPSAFVLAPAPNGASPAFAADAAGTQSAPPPAGAITGTGTVNFVPLWDSPSDIISSVIFQSGTGNTAKIGINTITPVSTLDIRGGSTVRGTLSLPATGAATATKGANSQPLDLAASAFSSTTSSAVNETFQWQAEPAGNDTSTPSGTLNLLFAQGAAKQSETGLQIGSNGQITFATGQTFPGTGTITGITTATGSGLTGGATSGTPSLSLLNTCANNQVLQWNGTSWVCATISGGGKITGIVAGTDLTGGGISGDVTLNLDTALVPQLFTNNTFFGTQTVHGTESITGATTVQTLLVNQAGTQAAGDAIHGITSSIGGTGVYGEGPVGIQGVASSSTGLAGLFQGTVTMSGANTAGALQVTNTVTSGKGPAIVGTTNSTGADAIKGIVAGFTGSEAGVFGAANSSSGYGVHGTNASNLGGVGVGGDNGGISVTGKTLCGSECNSGVWGDTNLSALGFFVSWAGVIGTADDNNAGYFENKSPTYATLYVQADGDSDALQAFQLGSGRQAGNFEGDLFVSGKITAGTKDFKIDHPIDPANKYLVHASVESSEMKNIYDGSVTTDGEGRATVQLPEWFEALNTDFRYQLTVIGQFAQAMVARKIENNRFEIRTSAPNVEVSWQVTGVRQDAYAKANPLVVEEGKDAQLRGFYIHPELYGAPDEKQIEWARHPEMMKRMKETRAKREAAAQK
ncbi:MAG TPA: hypothetical protein VN310_19720 [Candidatus Dormibacteraeota bacterium]|nr:hypothetical protein [Candidatus Dormibacteraeota bacterium]